MKKTLVALSLAALTAPALAQDKKAPEPDYTISGNFGLTSDYRFRGISQSNKKPAIQGGIDFAHKSGLYLGNWNSSVSEWAANDSAGIEQDLYGGYKFEAMGISFDLGAIYYYYPGARKSDTESKNVFNTREAYIGAGYGPISLKVSRTLGDQYFGLGKTPADISLTTDAKGTMYYDLSFSREIASKLMLKAHVGLTDLANKTAGTKDFTDYSIGVAYDLEGWVIGLTAYNTSSMSADTKAWYTSTDNRSKKLYDSGAAISITKAF
ncbi:TorF family putative porin [beta proteobacterium MWH-UniP1]